MHTRDMEKIIKDIQEHTILFSKSSPAFMQRLIQKSQRVKRKKNHLLFMQEDAAPHCFFVLSGWIKLYRETLDGTQIVTDILTAGNLFGETSIFNDGKHTYSAEIIKDSEIIAIPTSLIRSEIETNAKMAMDMVRHTMRLHNLQSKEIEHRTIQNASQRIGCFILRLIDQTHDTPVTLDLPYDKTLIASRLGMQPETFSRALKKLISTTDMQISGSTIHLNNPKSLVCHTCNACSSEYPCTDLQI